MKVVVEVNACQECPYLKSAKTFGNDGRDGCIRHYCAKGYFGRFEPGSTFYLEYHEEELTVIHPNCQLNQVDQATDFKAHSQEAGAKRKLKGGYCYGCETHYSVEELGVDEYYETTNRRRGLQESLGMGFYCKICEQNEDLIILVEE